MAHISLLVYTIILGLMLMLQGCDTNELKPWHTEELSLEFTADQLDTVSTFTAYRQLEERLYDQMEQQVYAKVATGKGYELTRYSKGSAADPLQITPDWNRSFELSTEAPAGGILLLHGMSDSPYSLKALGQRLHREGFWVIGLRLPGHGTVPSGLVTATWEDMAAAVKLAANHLQSQVSEKPLYVVGYSAGASLALNFTLDALENEGKSYPAGLILISPAIGIHPAAGLAGVKNFFSMVPGLGRLAWLSILPEFDPYKYNSFAANAGNQVHRVTRSVAKRIKSLSTTGKVKDFPPVLVFKSAVDATVSTKAIVNDLLLPLNSPKHELIIFDINRYGTGSSLLINNAIQHVDQLMEDSNLPFPITLVSNESDDSLQVAALHKQAFSSEAKVIKEIPYSWPGGVISLSHIALPYPPDDPLYGMYPPENDRQLYLGQINIKGERGLLKIPYDWLLRLRHNPFYGYLEQRTLQWISPSGDYNSVQ